VGSVGEAFGESVAWVVVGFLMGGGGGNVIRYRIIYIMIVDC
jgi:hypothetical protein